MQEKVIELLKKSQGFVSGEEISARLKVSRQALWKHVQDLRDAGYDIAAVPHLGYRLVSLPDRLYPFEITQGLHTRFVGKKAYYFDSIPSTIDVAFSLGLEGTPEGTVVVAETQTKGRGRLGRGWCSPKYKGLYVSVILRPPIPPNATPVLTLLTAVALCEAIQAVCGLDEARIKWPNDILMRNRKLGGILTELNAEMDATHFAVVSFGLNVNTDKKLLPEGATSLREHKKEEVSRVALLQEILRRIEAGYSRLKEDGAAAIIEKWRAYNVTLGRRVRVSCEHRHLEGEAVDIDSDGGLVLRLDSGLRQKVMSGDVVHCR